MSGLLNAIMGGAPDQTPDAQGLTNADRSQIGFNGLSSLGAILMAAGQPMWGPDRARMLALLAQVPGQMQEQRGQIVSNKRQKAQLDAETRQNEAAKAIQAMASNPEMMQNLPPSAQVLMKAALTGGNIPGIAEALKMSQPVPMGNGMVWDRNSNSIVNPITQTRMPLDGSAVSGAGQPDPTLDEIDSQTGRRERWLATQPQWLQDRLRKTAMGDMPLPSPGSRDPQAQMVNNAIGHYAPDYKSADYTAKQQFLSNITQGQLFQKVVAPAQKMINHAENYLKAYEALGNKDGLPGRVGNELEYWKSKALQDGRATGAETALKALKDEFTKFMRGTGGMTDQAERLQSQLSVAATPAETKAVIGQIVELMHGQLEPLSAQYRVSMKKPSATAADLLGDNARKALQNVEQWGPKAEGQQAQEQPPVAGAKKAPDGNWYVQKDGKFYMVK